LPTMWFQCPIWICVEGPNMDIFDEFCWFLGFFKVSKFHTHYTRIILCFLYGHKDENEKLKIRRS